MPCWQQLFPDVSVSFKLINEQQLQKNAKKQLLLFMLALTCPITTRKRDLWVGEMWTGDPAADERQGRLVGGKSRERGIPRDEGIRRHTRQTQTRTWVCARRRNDTHARTRAQAQIVSTGASTAISTNETVRSFMRSKLQTEFILLDQGWILVPGNAEL